jgi:hypothetical protein
VNEICKNIGIERWGCCCTQEKNSINKPKCYTSCAKAWRHETSIDGGYGREWELGYEVWNTCKVEIWASQRSSSPKAMERQSY